MTERRSSRCSSPRSADEMIEVDFCDVVVDLDRIAIEVLLVTGRQRSRR